MNRAHLRWWLFTCATFAVLIIAGIFGFYGALLRQDVTYLGFTVLALYLLSTLWLGIQLRRGHAGFDFVWYVAELMERAGLLGTFVGLAIAFQSLQHMDAGDGWKSELIAGISTKFLCSIVGLTGAMFLKTQIKILRAGANG